MTMLRSAFLTRRATLAGAAGLMIPRLGHAELTAKVVIGKDGWLFPAWEDVRRTNLARTKAVTKVLADAAAALRQGGLQIAFLLTPHKARVYADFLPADFQPDADFAGRYTMARTDLQVSGALVPDLQAFMAASRQAQSEPLFFKADTHWTAAGAELCAAEMGRQLRGLLPADAKRKGMSLGGYQNHMHTGDLVGLLPDSEQPKFKPERFRLRSAAALRGGGNNQGGLIDDSNADVAVIGNSYTQPYFGFPLVLSNQLNRPVDLSWQTARVGPYRTMLDYLASPLFKEQRPVLLVWHVMEGALEWPSDLESAWGPAAMPPAQFLDGLRQAVRRA